MAAGCEHKNINFGINMYKKSANLGLRKMKIRKQMGLFLLREWRNYSSLTKTLIEHEIVIGMYNFQTVFELIHKLFFLRFILHSFAPEDLQVFIFCSYSWRERYPRLGSSSKPA